MMRENKTTIRGLDQDLYRQAKVEAARLGITIGHWINQAILLKLSRPQQKVKT